MKNSKIYLAIAPFLLILFSCQDNTINMLTKINPDGSCTREYAQTTNAKFISGDTSANPFPFIIDSLWDVDVIWDTDSVKVVHEWPYSDLSEDTTLKKDNLRARAVRNFPLVEDLNNYNFYELTDWKSFQPEITFEKTFKWFYTYYEFSEKYPKYTPFDKVPISEYLDEKEVKFLFQGDDSYLDGMNGFEIKDRLDEINKQYEKWFGINYFEEQFEVITNHLDLIENPNISASIITEKKDTIFKKYGNFEDDFSNLLEIMDSTFSTNDFSNIMGENEDVSNEIENLTNFIDFYTMSANYELLMPGKIVQTNSSQAKGDTLYWKVDAYRFTEYDYEIRAESRKTNLWAFILSGVFILGVGLSYFVSFRGKK